MNKRKHYIERAVAAAKPTPTDAVDPKKVNMSAVYEQLITNTTKSMVKQVRWGDVLIPIRFKVLSALETEHVLNQTAQHYEKLGIEPTEDAFKLRLAAGILELACKEPEVQTASDGSTFMRPVFHDIDSVLALDEDSLAILQYEYALVRTELGIPDETTIQTQEDLEIWVNALAREASASFLAQQPLHASAHIMHLMALEILRLKNFPQTLWQNIGELKQLTSDINTGSSTSPVSEPTKESETSDEEKLTVNFNPLHNDFQTRDPETNKASHEKTLELLRQLENR